jgi:uncharacterized protein (DUF433 family)
MADWRERISVDPAICHGQVCVRGTRIPVTVVIDNVAAGRTTEQILRSYPTLTSEDVSAALWYAADRVAERIIELPGAPG